MPALTVFRVEDAGRLPTAATCMNFLKLPAYPSPDLMATKLSYAIAADTGFELS